MQLPNPSELPLKVLHLEITCSGHHRIKTSLSCRRTMCRDTVQAYEEAHVSLEGVTRRSQQLLTTLNKANHNGRLSSKLLQSLKESGQLLRDELMPPKLKEKLNTSDAHYLTISIDEQLVHIPWELLHDGQSFLCRRFVVGRVVQTRQDLHGFCESPNQGPQRMLVLADLDGSLSAAQKEGAHVRDLIESATGDIRVMMHSAHVDVEFLRTKIRRYDWVHFAGHTDYDDHCQSKTGWRLSDGWFTADDIAKMAGTGSMPKLIVANACQSARTHPWLLDGNRQKRHFGLVNAFLLSGTRHYVGTSWEIPDEPAKQFALAFYRCLTNGRSVGRAVWEAREKLIQSHGQEQIIWASYTLYGDPTYRYAPGAAASERSLPRQKTANRHAMSSVSVTRAADSTQPGGLGPMLHKYGNKRAIVVALCTLVIVLLGTITMRYYPRANSYDAQQAITAYRTGNFEQVLDLCPSPSSGIAPLVTCLLLRADVLYIQGELEEAGRLYGLALESSRATALESAEALIGLGRIASVRGRQQLALQYYQRAANAAPRRKAPVLALALLNERMGNAQQAIELLKNARHLAAPDDPTIDAMQRSLSAREALHRDKDRLELINRLIDELAHAPKDIEPALVTDHQRSGPIPVWLRGIESTGYSLQEGASVLLTSLMESHLQENPSLRLVDRHFMAMTLSELKLGASPLSDHKTRLKLGQLQAVRLIINGRIIFEGPETQITLRCIETETSQVVAVLVVAFDRHLSLPKMARQVSDQLIEKIKKAYP